MAPHIPLTTIAVPKQIQKQTVKKRDLQNKEYSETYNKSKLTKFFSLEDKNIDKVNKLLKEELKLRYKHIWIDSLPWPISVLVEAITMYAILYYVLNIDSEISLGTVYIFLYYIRQCFSPLKELFNQIEEIQTSQVSLERINTILSIQEKEEINKGLNIENLKGNIEFKNVDFQYNSNKLFENLNFKIEPNKMIAIVGKSGEGKSTILKLISKGYSVDSGKVLIDNYNINDLSEKTIKDNISIVSQSPYIFNLSIKDNIKLANPDTTDEEIIDVCKKAQIHDVIESMEDGYDTLVGENGVILSGGQKQRIAIARALIKKSKIILLDEATSSLDNSNQEKIKNVIKELSKDHTVIIVAHRLSTIVDADNIFVVDKHKICASGTHIELMNNCEEYKNLYEIEE